METKQNSLGKFLFFIWCQLVTFWDMIVQNVTTDTSGCLYIRHEKGALILHPMSLSKKNLDNEKNDELKKLLQKRLLGKFKYNLTTENSCIVVPNKLIGETLFYYCLTKGWYIPAQEEIYGLEQMKRSYERKGIVNIKFFYAEII